jgi:hypothetical protein
LLAADASVEVCWFADCRETTVHPPIPSTTRTSNGTVSDIPPGGSNVFAAAGNFREIRTKPQARMSRSMKPAKYMAGEVPLALMSSVYANQ